MANWHDGVTNTLEIAFASDPLDAVQVYTDVTAYFRGPASTFRGSTSLDIGASPGTFEFVLENGDRRFDPTHVTGPHYGSLKPMKRVRWTTDVGAVSEKVFTGYVSSWRQQWGELDGTVHLVAVEGFGGISRLALPDSAYEVEVVADGPFRYWPLQDTQGIARLGTDIAIPSEWQASDLGLPIGASAALTWGEGVLNVSHFLAQENVLPSAPTAIEGWFMVDDSSTSTVFLQASFGLTSWIRIQLTSAGSLEVGYSHAVDSLRTAAASVGVFNVTPGATYHVAALRSGSTLVVMVNGTRFPLTLSAGTHTAATAAGVPGIRIAGQNSPGATTATSAVSHIAVYLSPPTEARLQDHYWVGRYAWTGSHGDYGWEYEGDRINRALDDAGWPSAQRDIVTGSTRQAAYLPDGRPLLEYIREVAASGAGLLFFDVDGNVCYRDREWFWIYSNPDTESVLWNGVDMTWGGDPVFWGAGGVTFADDGTGLVYIAGNPAASDIDTVRNVVTVAYDRGGITQRDTTSIGDYGGEFHEVITARTITIPSDASNLAAYHLRSRKDPQDTFPEIVASMRDGTPETQFAGLLDLELGRVTLVKRTPMSTGAEIERRGLVLGIRHDVDAVDWVTTLFLTASPLSAQDAPYLTVGHETRGVIGAAANNLVPF
jgi:hypothetical protein